MAKKYTNKSSRDNNRCIPTYSSQKPSYLKINNRDASCLLLSLLLSFVNFFAPTIPLINLVTCNMLY